MDFTMELAAAEKAVRVGLQEKAELLEVCNVGLAW
jgi:hypothetical protein